MFFRNALVSIALIAGSSTLWGCNSGKAVPASAVLASLTKDVNKTSTAAVQTPVSSPVVLADYPLLQEVCTNTFKTANYKFDGEKMRFKVNNFAYKAPVEGHPNSLLYRHQYAVCFDFYPVSSSEQVQEALYVTYLGTIASDPKLMTEMVASVAGGYQALLSESGFHTGLSFSQNGWPSLLNKTYSDETSAVQYLKMNPLDMKVLNKYGGQKYDKLMAFEFVHGFVSNVTGVIQFHNITESVYEEVFSAGFPPATSD